MNFKLKWLKGWEREREREFGVSLIVSANLKLSLIFIWHGSFFSVQLSHCKNCLLVNYRQLKSPLKPI